MNKYGFISICKAVKVLPFYLFTLFLLACGTSSGYFKIEGRFLHINQGELYVYSPDGAITGMDTIKIEAGRFAYETKLDADGTLMLVFPNFSEHPVFAESGEAVEVKADASHLKEMTVKGTDDNELMNKFRKMVVSASPPEERQHATQFVKDHPHTRVSTYLIRKYFIQTPEPDYRQALSLLEIMLKEQPRDNVLLRLKMLVSPLAKNAIGSTLPNFSVTDINGKAVSDADYRTGTVVISVWMSQNYDSQEQQRLLRNMQNEGKALKLLSINIDPDVKDCKRIMEREEITWSVICDGMMMESKLVQQLGLTSLPDNIIVKDGRVIARGLDVAALQNKLNSLR